MYGRLLIRIQERDCKKVGQEAILVIQQLTVFENGWKTILRIRITVNLKISCRNRGILLKKKKRERVFPPTNTQVTSNDDIPVEINNPN